MDQLPCTQAPTQKTTGAVGRDPGGAGVIGASRILLLPAAVRARRWRVRVTGARGAVRIAEFGLYRSRG